MVLLRRVRHREQQVARLHWQWQDGDAVRIGAGGVAQRGARYHERGASTVGHDRVCDRLRGRHPARVHGVLGHAVYRGREEADSSGRRRKLAARPLCWRCRGGPLQRVEDVDPRQRQPGHGLGGHVWDQCRVAAEAGERGRRWHRNGRHWWRVAVRQRWGRRSAEVGLCDRRGGRVAAWLDERRDAPRLRPPHEPHAFAPPPASSLP